VGCLEVREGGLEIGWAVEMRVLSSMGYSREYLDSNLVNNKNNEVILSHYFF